MRQPLCGHALKGAALCAVLLALFSAHAQFGRGRFGRRFRTDPETQREQQLMEKSLDPAFKEDVFTFARLKFEADRAYQYGGWRSWDDDTPEADLNLIFRLFEVTSLKVRPGLTFIDITPKELANYPFVYLAAAGRVDLAQDEAAALRQYLLNGGFLMVDDFWGDVQWRHFYEQIKRVFPDREPVEMSLDHPIFHAVFNFRQQPQIPSVGTFLQEGLSYDPAPYVEKNHDPHYYGIYDDKERMMVLICHNNHYGDGWEHEGQDESYFDTYSEPMGYPMLINILVYATTH
ncbi:MAG: DUF4159 domain-containing protein [Verrucomicrobiota bacterium]